MTSQDDDPLVQMNVRVPRSVRDAIDQRRAKTGLSQSKWVTRMARWALAQPPPQPRTGRATRRTLDRPR